MNHSNEQKQNGKPSAWAGQHNFRAKREVRRLRRVQTTRIMCTPVHVEAI